MMVVPRVRRACVDSRRRSLPSVVVTVAAAFSLASAPRPRLVAATSSTTMDSSSSAESTDKDNGDGTSNSFDSNTPSPSSRPKLMTGTSASTAAPTAEETTAPEGSLGAGTVIGTLSATGVSMLLIDDVGKEGAIQAVSVGKRAVRFTEAAATLLVCCRESVYFLSLPQASGALPTWQGEG